MVSPRRQRFDAFSSREHQGLAGLSADHIASAVTLFQAALDDRTKGNWRQRDNHYTPHSLGCVVMITTTFETWLNELIAWENLRDDQHAPLAQRSTVEKYEGLCSLDGGSADPVRAELALLVEVRNECVHHLPATFQRGELPLWLAALKDRNLLVATGRDTEFEFSQRFSSFKLALWAMRTTEACVTHLIDQVSPNRAARFELLARNFSLYRQVYEDGLLEQMDRELGLEHHDVIASSEAGGG